MKNNIHVLGLAAIAHRTCAIMGIGLATVFAPKNDLVMFIFTAVVGGLNWHWADLYFWEITSDKKENKDERPTQPPQAVA